MANRNLFLVFTLFGISAFAFAQGNEVSLTVGGVMSTGKVSVPVICPALFGFPCPSNNISTHAAFAANATFAHRIVGSKAASISFELPLMFAPNRTVNWTGTSGTTVFARQTFRNSTLFFTPSAKVNLFPSSWISPFGSVGGGLAHYGRASDDNEGALHFGGGVDIKTPIPFFSLRGEVRDFYSKRPSFEQNFIGPGAHQHNLFAGAGLVFRF